jgi:uncharacterized protein YneF (UPF0154 family)
MTLFLILLVWIVLSIPAGLLVGKFIHTGQTHRTH